MKWWTRSFRNREQIPQTAFVIVAGGMLHVGHSRLKQQVAWRDPLLFSEVTDRRILAAELAKVMTRRTTTVLVGLEGMYVRLTSEMLAWNRLRPDTAVTVPEMRAVRRELEIRGREALRKSRAQASGDQYVETLVERITVEGRRVVNPVGFPGGGMAIAAVHCSVAPDIAILLDVVRSQIAHAIVQMFPLDWAMQLAVTGAGAPFPAVILGESSTTVYEGSGVRRHVVHIGEEGLAQHLSRLDPDAGAEEIAGFLYAYQENDRRHRELMAMAMPAVRRWARAVEHLLATATSAPRDSAVTLLFPWRVVSPIRQAVRPDVRRQVFTALPDLRWQTTTSPELLQEPAATRHDAYAALLRRTQARSVHTANWI